ncbi:hypothetical protein GI374_03170 [Paracoccus sp. S-4012]|uniref:hypothetical protein n=1 Tax=Paracoccus sp. S-4012 TaxID=2665648 RepID=UPI0012B1597E|nr:hypothetical protein [Paracoccus sp. S-4012]MRX49462.1 hypothetical protein [Paracoccus sp. S-4012]
MDQLLLDTVHRIEAEWRAREVRLLKEIGSLRRGMAARDEAIANLTALLDEWLDPSELPRS